MYKFGCVGVNEDILHMTITQTNHIAHCMYMCVHVCTRKDNIRDLSQGGLRHLRGKGN